MSNPSSLPTPSIVLDYFGPAPNRTPSSRAWRWVILASGSSVVLFLVPASVLLAAGGALAVFVLAAVAIGGVIVCGIATIYFAIAGLCEPLPYKFIRFPIALGIGILELLIGTANLLPCTTFTNHTGCSREAAAKAEISGIESALDAFRIDCGRLPITVEGITALLVAPPGAQSWNGPYLRKFPIDPWGHEYIYRFPGVHNPAGHDLSSLGEDGVPSNDDIGNWTASSNR